MNQLTKYQKELCEQLAMGPVTMFPVRDHYEEVSQLAEAGLVYVLDGLFMMLTRVGFLMFKESGLRRVQ